MCLTKRRKFYVLCAVEHQSIRKVFLLFQVTCPVKFIFSYQQGVCTAFYSWGTTLPPLQKETCRLNFIKYD